MRGDTGQQQRREGDARGDGGPARISFFTRERTRTSCSQRAGRRNTRVRSSGDQTASSSPAASSLTSARVATVYQIAPRPPLRGKRNGEQRANDNDRCLLAANPGKSQGRLPSKPELESHRPQTACPTTFSAKAPVPVDRPYDRARTATFNTSVSCPEQRTSGGELRPHTLPPDAIAKEAATPSSFESRSGSIRTRDPCRVLIRPTSARYRDASRPPCTGPGTGAFAGGAAAVCQGRLKMHPFAPVENAPPLVGSVCRAGEAGPGWVVKVRERS